MEAICKYRSIQALLQDWVNERKLRNPRLSLAAHASYFKMAPSMLSQVLHGKRNISVRQASHIADRLRLPSKEKRHIELLAEIALYQGESSNDQSSIKRSELLERLRVSGLEAGRERLNEDRFRHFSDWYSLPILVLCSQPDLSLGTEEISKRLGLDLNIVQNALERMGRIGVLRQNEVTGMWHRSGAEILLSSEGKNKALREFHKQMLRRTVEAVELSPIEERYIGTETFRFSLKHMGKARAIIDHCLDSLLSLEKESMSEEESALYHAGVQFFKITDFPKRIANQEAG